VKRGVNRRSKGSKKEGAVVGGCEVEVEVQKEDGRREVQGRVLGWT
jgi:hypothetical protein